MPLLCNASSSLKYVTVKSGTLSYFSGITAHQQGRYLDQRAELKAQEYEILSTTEHVRKYGGLAWGGRARCWLVISRMMKDNREDG